MEDETMNDMDPEEDEVDENVQEMLDVRANLRHVGSDGDGGKNNNSIVTKLNKDINKNNNNRSNNNSNLSYVGNEKNDNNNSDNKPSVDGGKNNDINNKNTSKNNHTKSTDNKSLYAPRTLKPKSKEREWKSKSLHSIFTPRDETETDIDSVDDNELTDIFKR